MKKNRFLQRFSRAMTVLVAAVLFLSISLGAGSSPFTVSDTSEFLTALEDASHASGAQVIYLLDSSTVVDLSSGTYSIPSNVTVQLNSGTLRVSGATLYVSGAIAGSGTLTITAGTLVRNGGSITSGIAVSGSGAVRGARTLTLENLDITSGETIVSLSYKEESGTDTSGFVTKAASAPLYAKMGGSGFASFLTIETVITDAGNVFRLGTKNTDTLSLQYTITYGGLSGAKLATLNPTSYTASDAAITLVNPTKSEHTFAGWTCAVLGITTPVENMVIPEGTTGDLTFVANWEEGMQNDKSGASGGTTTGSTTDSDTTDDAATQQEDAAAQDTATTSTRRVKTASSSTKVTFTSDVNPVLPTIETVQGNAFPWGWLFGGAAGFAVLIYIAAIISRKIRERK